MPLFWQRSVLHWEGDQRCLVARAKKVPDSEEREAPCLISYTEGKWPAFAFPLNLPYIFAWGLPQGYCWALCPDCWETENSFTTLLQVITIHSDFLSCLLNAGEWTLRLPASASTRVLWKRLEQDQKSEPRSFPLWPQWIYSCLFTTQSFEGQVYSQEALEHVGEVVVSWHMI